MIGGQWRSISTLVVSIKARSAARFFHQVRRSAHYLTQADYPDYFFRADNAVELFRVHVFPNVGRLGAEIP